MSINWNFNSKYRFSDKNFADIYAFYVIETPVPGTSVRGTNFGNAKTNMTKLTNILKKEIPVLKEKWEKCKASDVELKCKEYDAWDSVTLPCEFAIHSKSKNNNVFSLLYSIRCSFAHGAFSIHSCKGEKYYFLENKNKGKIKGRIVIKESTLIQIMNIVKKEL